MFSRIGHSYVRIIFSYGPATFTSHPRLQVYLLKKVTQERLIHKWREKRKIQACGEVYNAETLFDVKQK